MSSASRLVLPDGRVHELFGTCSFGRHASNSLVLVDDHVSSQHALIQWQQGREDQAGGGFLLVDLGSTNGSYVNGRRVAKPVVLKDGDIIDLGSCRIEYRTDDNGSEVTLDSLRSTVLDIKQRNIWLMVADIVGSTRMTQELPPEEVAHIFGKWFKSCREVVESHDGQMNQYLGDGFFCYWEDTLEAKRRIPEILRHFSNYQTQGTPRFRVVLHYGLTVLGSVPTLSALNLQGPNVHFVFRMEKLAGSLGEPVLLSEKAAGVLALSTRSRHDAELAGFDGRFHFVVPDLGQ